MDLIEEVVGGITVVVVAGRLDAQSAGPFGDRLIALIGSGQIRLLIDASKLGYVSSMGFRALLIAAKSVADKGGRLALCDVTASIRRLMELAAFDQVFETYASREDALARLAK